MFRKLIDHHPVLCNRLPEIRVSNSLFLNQINRAFEKLLQRFFETKVLLESAQRVFFRKVYDEINIAVLCSKIASRRRTK